MDKPNKKPQRPTFSSGPCAKYPGWDLTQFRTDMMGRSHRSSLGKQRIREAFEETRQILKIPDDYHIGMIAGSDSGAFECAMWNFLGTRPVDVFAWESFGKGWVTDITKQLRLPANVYDCPYGELPNLDQANWDNDVVFLWNGTTSGVCLADAQWIDDQRHGLSLCDATSAVFAMDIPWKKIDVLSFSWQKCLGSEGAHGMLVLSPRAIERLENNQASWPLPKLFRLKKGIQLNRSIFIDSPINTPSMLAFEDLSCALKWAREIGGLPALIERADANLKKVLQWLEHEPAFRTLTVDPKNQSNTSVCLVITDPAFTSKDENAKKTIINRIAKLLEEEKVAYDIKSYRDAPMGFRLWCGPTVESSDVEIVTKWISYAYRVCMH